MKTPEISLAARCGRDTRWARGFSLVEILVVSAVLVVLLAIAVPAFTTIAQGTAVTSAGDLLADNLLLAAQDARTRNRTVEFRLIKMPSADGGGGSVYRAVQLWASRSDNSPREPFQRLILLPGGAAVSESASLSPLLPASAGTMTVQGESREYAALVFRANGTVAVLGAGGAQGTFSASEGMLTIVPERYAGSAETPDNFYSVHINPVTGAVRAFRP